MKPSFTNSPTLSRFTSAYRIESLSHPDFSRPVPMAEPIAPAPKIAILVIGSSYSRVAADQLGCAPF